MEAASARHWPMATLLLALWTLLAGPVAEAQTPARETFKDWLEALWPEAEAFGITRATFDSALRGVEPDLTLPDLEIPGRARDASGGQAEFVKPPQDYLAKSYLERLAAQGRTLRAAHARALASIEQELGVQGEVVLAIWGRETAYGTYRLPHYAIRALATQAYLGRRKDMFRSELLHALKMLEDGVIARDAMRSSWAGAMGLPQLMPSEYYSWAYDLDGDGRKDIWNSVPDALASAARQLQGKGWVSGRPWGYEVRLPARVDCALEGPANARTVADWEALGIRRADGRPFSREERALEAYLMMPGGRYGPAFLALENFKVLRRYNMSDLYALFVGHLADRIAGGGDFVTPWQSIAQLAARHVEEIQRRLKAQGFAIDKIDGKVGSNTRWQIGAYQKSRGAPPDCWPTAALLRQLRSASAQGRAD
jgi:lytic murein transglycosylase